MGLWYIVLFRCAIATLPSHLKTTGNMCNMNINTGMTRYPIPYRQNGRYIFSPRTSHLTSDTQQPTGSAAGWLHLAGLQMQSIVSVACTRKEGPCMLPWRRGLRFSLAFSNGKWELWPSGLHEEGLVVDVSADVHPELRPSCPPAGAAAPPSLSPPPPPWRGGGGGGGIPRYSASPAYSWYASDCVGFAQAVP